MVTSATVTTTTATQFIPTIWEDGVLNAVEFAARLQKRVNRSFEDSLTMGNSLKIPRLSNLTTQTKSSGLANVINWEAITEGVQTITVSTHEYAAFLIEEIAATQANQDLRSKYEKKIGYALSRGREVSLAALPASLTNSVGTLNVELTSDDYLSAYSYLMQAGLMEDDVDPGEDFSVFLSPQAYVAALKTDVFINRDYNKNADAIGRALIGDIYGMPVFVSNLMKSNSSGHDCLMTHREGFALIVQKVVPVRSSYIIENFADGVAGWNVYGVSEVNFPPETPGGDTAVDNRSVWLKTV